MQVSSIYCISFAKSETLLQSILGELKVELIGIVSEGARALGCPSSAGRVDAQIKLFLSRGKFELTLCEKLVMQ